MSRRQLWNIFSKSMNIYAFHNDFSAPFAMALWSKRFSETAARIDLHAWYVGKLIKRTNWKQVYFAQRHNKHPTSASHCDRCAFCFIRVGLGEVVGEWIKYRLRPTADDDVINFAVNQPSDRYTHRCVMLLTADGRFRCYFATDKTARGDLDWVSSIVDCFEYSQYYYYYYY